MKVYVETTSDKITKKVRTLMKKPVIKLNIFYSALLVLLYCGFWLGWYSNSIGFALGFGIAVVAIAGIIFLIFGRKTPVTIIFGLSTGIGVGLTISAFFLHFDLEPSRFFGLVLLIFLGIKCLQAFVCAHIPFKRIFIVSFIALEITATILVCVFADLDYALMSQIAFGLAVGIFLSLGQIGFFSRKNPEDTWKNAAMGLLIGYAIIFLIVISIIFEGGGLEGIGDLSSGGPDVSKKKKIEEQIVQTTKFK
ncbi:MAG: hypothetical protein FWD89_04600 [Firmicutes bacterium]|nr:hypothetical protein [Bacillota bacterium]MCL2771561.1 hypothetical protein [Bacillota bacterium]